MKIVSLFHITFEANLEGIIEKEGLVPGGNQNGLSNTIGKDFFIEDYSSDKIFMSVEWAGMVPYIEHLKSKGEEDQKPVILLITIPFDEIEDFGMYQDTTKFSLEGGKAPMQSWFFIKSIPIKYIDIATYDDPTLTTWSFRPLADYDVDEDSSTLLDVHGLEDLSDYLEYDMDHEVREAIEEMLEKLQHDAPERLSELVSID